MHLEMATYLSMISAELGNNAGVPIVRTVAHPDRLLMFGNGGKLLTSALRNQSHQEYTCGHLGRLV